MKRQTSCFNMAIFRSDIKRLWWVSALHTLTIFILGLLPLYITYHNKPNIMSYVAEHYIDSTLCDASSVPYVFLGIITVGLSALIFSYLNSKSAAGTMHAIPVKRKTLYITHSVFGILSLILPILINGIILVLMRTNSNIYAIVSINHIAAWIITQITYSIIGFAFSTLIGMFTGNSVAHIIFSYIFAVFPLFVEYAIEHILNLNLYGYALSGSDMFVQKYIYFGLDKLTDPIYLATYLVYAIIFFTIGYFIYKIRNLENTSEIIAFPKLKPVFIYGVAICFGVVGYFYFSYIMDIKNLFLILPLGILGLIIANMLTKKAFTFKGVLKHTIALTITVTAVFCLFHFDITGFEKRTPDLSSIKSVSVTANSHEQAYYGMINGKKLVKKDQYFPVMTKMSDIENVLEFHEKKIKERTSEKVNSVYYIRYNLNNGRTLTRRYEVNYDEDKEVFAPIMETKENLTYRFPVLNDSTENIVSVSITDQRLSKAFNLYYTEKDSDSEIANKLIDALRKDLLSVKYDEFIYGESTLTRIEINRKTPLLYEGTDIPVPYEYMHITDEYETYYIRQSYKNTINLLTELGFYDVIPKAEDYNEIEVNMLTSKSGKIKTITDPYEIAEIYKYVEYTQTNLKGDLPSDSTLELEFKSDSATNFSTTRTISEDSPQYIKSLLN